MTEKKKTLLAEIKNAFAVDAQENFSPEEMALLEKAATKVVQRQMTTPAVIFLESARPLNWIGSQAMTFFQPILGLVVSTKEFEMMAKILEKRKSIDVLIELIERKDAESIKKKTETQTKRLPSKT
ncbi:MAG: hypothetical protein KAS70_06790 [Planctomycetes bacterium]|nr:hypothetical protein [Planctomycetota bacterium]